MATGLVLYLLERRRHPDGDAEEAHPAPEEGDAGAGQECCGLHAVCEKKYGSAGAGEIVYYDDEELDALAGRDPGSYTPDEIEELRDVVMTLRAEEAYGWSLSLQRRGIELPSDIRDELMLLIGEASAT